MDLTIEKDKEVKEEKLDISVREFKRIYKESCRNIIEVNKQIELIKDILNFKNLSKLENMHLEIKERFLNLEEFLNSRKYNIDVFREQMVKMKDDIRKEENKLTNISINNMKLLEDYQKAIEEIKKIKSFYSSSFIALGTISFLTILSLIIFR